MRGLQNQSRRSVSRGRRPLRTGAKLCKAAGAEQLERPSPSALSSLFSHNPAKVK